MIHMQKYQYPVVILFILAYLIIKLIIGYATPILPDEAYYWLWGQRLQLSYYDHPPLQAYMQRIFQELFGTNTFVIRLPAIFSSAIMYVSFLFVLNKLNPHQNTKSIILGLLIVFSSPGLLIATTIVFADHLLLALISAAFALSVCVLHDFKFTGSFKKYQLYLASVLIGLAHLTKYNAVLFLIPMLLYIIYDRDLRAIFLSYHVYLAAIIMLLSITPIIVWNFQNDFVSFTYNLSVRMDKAISIGKFFGNSFMYVIDTVILLSPLLIIHVYNALKTDATSQYKEIVRGISIASIVTAICFVSLISVSQMVYGYWTYISFIPVIFYAAANKISLARITMNFIYCTILVLSTLFIAFSEFDFIREESLFHNWSKIVRNTKQLQNNNKNAFLLSTDYRIGSIWAFHLDNINVNVLTHRESQFTHWFDNSSNDGRNAVILANDTYPLTPAIIAKFQTIKQVAMINSSSVGKSMEKKMSKYRFYIGTNYRANACIPDLIRLHSPHTDNHQRPAYRYGCSAEKHA